MRLQTLGEVDYRIKILSLYLGDRVLNLTKDQIQEFSTIAIDPRIKDLRDRKIGTPFSRLYTSLVWEEKQKQFGGVSQSHEENLARLEKEERERKEAERAASLTKAQTAAAEIRKRFAPLPVASGSGTAATTPVVAPAGPPLPSPPPPPKSADLKGKGRLTAVVKSAPSSQNRFLLVMLAQFSF